MMAHLRFGDNRYDLPLARHRPGLLAAGESESQGPGFELAGTHATDCRTVVSRMTHKAKSDEWVIVSETDHSCLIVRRGFQTALEAAAVRSEMERDRFYDNANLMLLTHKQALKITR